VPEDLSGVWPVRLGAATELLNLEWYSRKANSDVTRIGAVVVHPSHPWATCTLDGWDSFLACPIECKHVGGREPLEVIIDRYQPQCQWLMEVTGAKTCALSVIVAANEPIVEFVEYDEDYIDELVERATQFMLCVRERRPPVALAPVEPPADASVIYDMTSDERWKLHAERWLQAHGAADIAKDSEKCLKALVPDDAKKCHGHGCQISRDRAGRLSLREMQS